MSHPVQDHADAFLALLRAATGSPSLVVYDGAVDSGGTPPYALLYFYIETPDGLTAPDAVPLTFRSDVIDAWAIVHCVGENAVRARAVSGRVRLAVLNKVLTVPGRECHPVYFRQSQPPQRDESTGRLVMDQVDTYSFRTQPA